MSDSLMDTANREIGSFGKDHDPAHLMAAIVVLREYVETVAETAAQMGAAAHEAKLETARSYGSTLDYGELPPAFASQVRSAEPVLRGLEGQDPYAILDSVAFQWEEETAYPPFSTIVEIVVGQTAKHVGRSVRQTGESVNEVLQSLVKSLRLAERHSLAARTKAERRQHADRATGPQVIEGDTRRNVTYRSSQASDGNDKRDGVNGARSWRSGEALDEMCGD